MRRYTRQPTSPQSLPWRSRRYTSRSWSPLNSIPCRRYTGLLISTQWKMNSRFRSLNTKPPKKCPNICQLDSSSSSQLTTPLQIRNRSQLRKHLSKRGPRRKRRPSRTQPIHFQINTANLMKRRALDLIASCGFHHHNCYRNSPRARPPKHHLSRQI